MATKTKSAAHKKSATSSQAKTTKKKAAKKKAANKSGSNCWPGFEPVAGKKPGTKGSCKRVPGAHSKSTKKATQKAAAASKLEKQG